MKAVLFLLNIKKNRGTCPRVERARQNLLRRRQVMPLREKKMRKRELIV
ncbi:hypothetical protein AA15973_2416 [Komagataeibacter sucrofermentans DSM 15973]|nr:hypothetical protein AA15973_2416 [Komagataeibacter sucrofermentans DSM 15973]